MRRLLDLAEERIANMLNDAVQLASKAIDYAIAAYKSEVSPEEVRRIASALHAIQDDIIELAMEAIARYGPVAFDLRFLRVAMEVSYDLYRIARYAYDVADAIRVVGVKCPSDRVESLSMTVKDMMRRAVSMVLTRDLKDLEEIRRLDDELADKAFINALRVAVQNPTPCAVAEAVALRLLERASDHAVYIANRAYFLATGQQPR